MVPCKLGESKNSTARIVKLLVLFRCFYKYYTGYAPARFPDVCIGVNGAVFRSARIIAERFQSEGYSVKINEPFAGALVPLKYGNDPRVQSVMIELNRRIYDNASFPRIRQICKDIYEKLSF